MAYKGRKVFTAGEVLTSSDMNSTVDQTVMVFADATARDTAIPTAVEGMIVYLEDTNEVLKYDSAAWVAIIETADDVITTEGDLLVGGVNGVAERVAIGGVDTVLTSDGTTISWAAGGSGGESFNFIVDMNNTSNNTASTSTEKPAGVYEISLVSGDTAFDVYLISSAGVNVGYSNNNIIQASAGFDTVVILGVSTTEIISFVFAESLNNANAEGNESGAGAYLESITPTDLPNIDDTATVVGGNFGANTEITFESGATVLPAKSITVNTSTELLVTRPDALIEDDAPYTVRAITTGVPQPTGSNVNILVDAITAGSDPTFVTTSPLPVALLNSAYSESISATDAESAITNFAVVVGSLPTGLTLNSSSGLISGTPTSGATTFTIRVTDAGGNTTDKEFELPVQVATGGTVTNEGGFIYHTFTSTDDFVALATITDLEYLIIAGGGGGATNSSGVSTCGGGGGGAGGLLQGTTTISASTISMIIGAGGAGNTNGTDSTFTGVDTANGGGAGRIEANGNNGGSGGGGGTGVRSGGTGIAGQGTDGGGSNNQNGGGGGGGKTTAGQFGTHESGTPGNGGNGIQLTDYASASGIDVDGGHFAGGGGAGNSSVSSTGGLGGGGFGAVGSTSLSAQSADANTGGGGGGTTGSGVGTFGQGGSGGSGLIVVRYI